MRQSSVLHLPLELAFSREVLFAVEVLDAVTMERVSRGITVTAEGLLGKPILNSGDMFVWRQEDFTRLQRLVVDPGVRPFERVELDASEVERPHTRIELPPRIDYPFNTGTTGLRARLIESPVSDPADSQPIADASVRLRWVDEDGDWHDAPTRTRTHATTGDFVSILRLAPGDEPLLDAKGAMSVRLRFSRDGYIDRTSSEFKLQQGRITNPTKEKPLTFVWDEMTS